MSQHMTYCSDGNMKCSDLTFTLSLIRHLRCINQQNTLERYHYFNTVLCLSGIIIIICLGIGRVEHHLKEGYDDQLKVDDTTEQCTHRDENNRSCNVGTHHSGIHV